MRMRQMGRSASVYASVEEGVACAYLTLRHRLRHALSSAESFFPQLVTNVRVEHHLRGAVVWFREKRDACNDRAAELRHHGGVERALAPLREEAGRGREREPRLLARAARFGKRRALGKQKHAVDEWFESGAGWGRAGAQRD